MYGFYRGKVLFAKLQQEELYFLNNNGSFAKFDQSQIRVCHIVCVSYKSNIVEDTIKKQLKYRGKNG